MREHTDSPKSDRKKGAGAQKPPPPDAAKKKKQKNKVDEAGEESFPASDPPSFNPGATKKHG